MKHYGAHFEDVEAGVHGPVELVADGETIRVCRIMNGPTKLVWMVKSMSFSILIIDLESPGSDNLPSNQNFTW